MNADDHESRISKLEQRFVDHEHHAGQRFDRNDMDHEAIKAIVEDMHAKVETIESVVISSRAWVLGAFWVVTSIAAFVIASWDWLIKRLGHN